MHIQYYADSQSSGKFPTRHYAFQQPFSAASNYSNVGQNAMSFGDLPYDLQSDSHLSQVSSQDLYLSSGAPKRLRQGSPVAIRVGGLQQKPRHVANSRSMAVPHSGPPHFPATNSVSPGLIDHLSKQQQMSMAPNDSSSLCHHLFDIRSQAVSQPGLAKSFTAQSQKIIGYLSDSSSDSDDEPDPDLMENYPLISDPFIDHETDPDGLMGTEIDDLYDIDGLGTNTYDHPIDEREIMKRLEINLQPF